MNMMSRYKILWINREKRKCSTRLLTIIILLFCMTFSETSTVKSIQKSSFKTVSKNREIVQKITSRVGYFTENKGQWDPSILFVGETNFGRMAFGKDCVYFETVQPSTSEDIEQSTINQNKLSKEILFKKKSQHSSEFSVIRHSFSNAKTSSVKGIDPLRHYNNYILGKDKAKWATGCRNFTKIVYNDIKEGVDLLFFFSSEALRYELLSSTSQEDILLSQLKDMLPFMIPRSKECISLKNMKSQGFTTPSSLIFSTLMGSSRDDDFVYDMTLDSFGNSYVAGETYSIDFPVSNGSIQKTNKKEGDGVIFKLNPEGNDLLFSTFLGGSGTDYVKSIEATSDGSIYVTGSTTSLDFPTTTYAYRNKSSGKNDVFIAKLNFSATSLIYATYLGGSDADYPYGIAVDSFGNAYISGTTASSDFPISMNAYRSKYHGNYDAFVSKINPTGSILLYSLVISGSNYDYGRGIVLDKSCNAYVTGSTGSYNFPVTSGAYQSTIKGLGNAFVSKINPTGSNLLYSTFIGGSDYDYSYSIALDSSNNVYIAGGTSSLDYPITTQVFQANHKGKNDSFLTKINSSGANLIYSTFLGGSGEDSISSITIDFSGNTYVCGTTDSLDFPITPGSFQTKNMLSNDVFVSKINSKGSSLLRSTYLGGSFDDMGYNISLDNTGNVYIAGDTMGADFPVTPDAYWNNQSGESDIFVTKMNLDIQNDFTNPSSILIELWIGYRIALVNGELEFLDTVPILVNNSSVVPLRFIAESFKSTVLFNPKTQEIDILYGDNDIVLWIGKPIAQVSSIRNKKDVFQVFLLDVSPFIRNSRTMVPIRFIAEAFGAHVTWNSLEQKISITLKN